MLDNLIAQLNGALAVRKISEGDIPFAVFPADYKIEKLEHLLENPIVTRQTITVRDITSFSEYAKKHANPDSTVFANDGWESSLLHVKPSVLAIFDYHGKDKPHHGAHSAKLVPRLSEAWVRWVTFCDKSFGQAEFARFLEENMIDIAEPEGASLVEITRGIQATQKGEFKSGVRLQNGSFNLTYAVETTASVVQGNLEIPEFIKLGIPVFENDVVYSVKAWLRYGIEDGKLKLRLELHRPRFIYHDAFMTIMAKVKEAMPDNLVLLGTP